MPWAETLVIGVLASLAFTHWTGWSPGGLITPGYLVLYLPHWRASLVLFSVALITWLLALALRRWLPLYGRRRWGFCVATAATLRGLLEILPGAATPNALGLVVPGLIASSCTEQGVGPTLTGLITVTAATWLLLIALGEA